MNKVMKSKVTNVKKMKKAELFESLYYCPKFRMEKRGAFEMLGIMCKDVLIEYYLQYCI